MRRAMRLSNTLSLRTFAKGSPYERRYRRCPGKIQWSTPGPFRRAKLRCWHRRPVLATGDSPSELLVSELITNAIHVSRHLNVRADVPAVPVVHLWVISDGSSIIVYVWDANNDMPQRRNGRPDEEGGRGLMLVETLAKDWGAYRQADGGKVVWVQISDP